MSISIFFLFPGLFAADRREQFVDDKGNGVLCTL